MKGENIPESDPFFSDYMELQKLDRETYDLCEEKRNPSLKRDRPENLAILRDELEKAISRRGGRFETKPDGRICVYSKAGVEYCSGTRGTETEKLLSAYLSSLRGLRAE